MLLVARQMLPRFQLAAFARPDALLRAFPSPTPWWQAGPECGDAWFMRSRIYTMLYVATQNPVWRDSALRDLKQASVIVGRPCRYLEPACEGPRSRPDCSGMPCFSVEQGEATDYLHTNAAALLFSRASAELALQQFEKARAELSTRRCGVPGYTGVHRRVRRRCLRGPRATCAMRSACAHSRIPWRRTPGTCRPFTVDELRLYAVAIQARAGMPDSRGARVSVGGGWMDRRRGPGAPSGRGLCTPGAGRPRQRARPRGAGGATGFGHCFQRRSRLPWYQPLREHPLFAAAMSGIAPAEARRR